MSRFPWIPPDFNRLKPNWWNSRNESSKKNSFHWKLFTVNQGKENRERLCSIKTQITEPSTQKESYILCSSQVAIHYRTSLTPFALQSYASLRPVARLSCLSFRFAYITWYYPASGRFIDQLSGCLSVRSAGRQAELPTENPTAFSLWPLWSGRQVYSRWADRYRQQQLWQRRWKRRKRPRSIRKWRQS